MFEALKKMIGADNDRYFRLFDQLRAVAIPATMSYPNLMAFGRQSRHVESLANTGQLSAFNTMQAIFFP